MIINLMVKLFRQNPQKMLIIFVEWKLDKIMEIWEKFKELVE